MKAQLDMDQLAQFNPKLHKQIQENPESLLQLQEVLFAHEKHAELAAAQEAVQAVAENYQYKKPNVYAVPFLWAFATPVFAATAAALI
jgi:hypothetical protein